MDDSYFLQKAIEIGNKKAAPYNFGGLVVKNGEIIAAEHSHVQETNNPTLHAEISAIIQACQKEGMYNLEGCTLYASHEPCLMCMSCAAWAQIDRVVYDIPASEQTAFDYALKDFSIQDFAEQIPRSMKVKNIRLVSKEG